MHLWIKRGWRAQRWKEIRCPKWRRIIKCYIPEGTKSGCIGIIVEGMVIGASGLCSDELIILDEINGD